MTNKDKYYFSGGLAETVYEPSEITYSFFGRWFSGDSSLGLAMKLLDLPYEKIAEPVLVMKGDDMWVDLKAEERTLYKKTIFSYLPVKGNKQPKLIVNPLKLLNPVCLWGTMQLLVRQSVWLSDLSSIEKMVDKWEKEIEKRAVPLTIADCDWELANFVWPRVLACGMLAEFFMKLIEANDRGGKYAKYLSSKAAEKDWFFRSLTDMDKVKHGQWSIFEYLKVYGLRADKDYELTCPRWYESKVNLLAKIRSVKHLEHTAVDFKNVSIENNNKYLETALQLLIVRSEMRREALRFVDGLRKALVAQGEIRGEKKKVRTGKKKAEVKVMRGRGVIGERGIVSGRAFVVETAYDTIPRGAIGIFPNASPEFSVLYPQCKGIIFLRGGMTSHGVIVAREYGIPAIIDGSADGIENGEMIKVDGDNGVWEITKTNRIVE